jgi:pyroglutamyl-peptidase
MSSIGSGFSAAGADISAERWRFLAGHAHKIFPGVYEQGGMTATILITGFGPFPGAPFNPTEPLVMALAGRRHPFANARRVAHVFRVSYEAVDRELPALLAREKPDVLVMFGLAGRTKHVRIETRARNAFTRTMPDAGGCVPVTAAIVPQAPATLPLRAPAQRLVAAAQAAGVPAALSRDAGRYLCNYLCWRAAEATGAGAPRLTAFIHVPLVRRGRVLQPHRAVLTLDDLIRAGEAIVQAALAAAR